MNPLLEVRMCAFLTIAYPGKRLPFLIYLFILCQKSFWLSWGLPVVESPLC